ncbi:MAG: A/G-specific adenine glycosylase [Planctomycetota bacterium]
MRTDADRARAIEHWFGERSRDLPWRRETAPGRRDPYRTLVSELMLQQTQVSRVVEKFEPFLERFPTARDLADADEDDVLAMWSGLGYYRRARLLHAAAKAIRDDFGGATPETEPELRSLPGVGRYTASAVAAFAAGARTPVVDGNVSRVLLRLEGEAMRHAAPETERWAWARASTLTESIPETVGARAVSEGLMELGATICTPRNPSCDDCPIRPGCVAASEGRQHDIPLPKVRSKRRELFVTCAVVTDPAGRVLMEQRPGKGLWARMWQPIASEADAPEDARRALTARLSAITSAEPVSLGSFAHVTTHREVRFEVLGGEGPAASVDGARWVDPSGLDALAVSNAHLRALRLASRDGAGSLFGS